MLELEQFAVDCVVAVKKEFMNLSMEIGLKKKALEVG
jgi:hypothetical protein